MEKVPQAGPSLLCLTNVDLTRFLSVNEISLGITWPYDMAEQCSRHRRKGAQCLSVASLRGAGVGEPRREPEGPQYGQHGFDYFCQNKSRSAAGPRPSITGKQGARCRSSREQFLHGSLILLPLQNEPPHRRLTLFFEFK